jgi:hypothetical protein
VRVVSWVMGLWSVHSLCRTHQQLQLPYCHATLSHLVLILCILLMFHRLKFRNLLAELQPSTRGDAYLFCDSDETFQITTDLTVSMIPDGWRRKQHSVWA